MNELIEIIDVICEFGLYEDLTIDNKEETLEQSLVRLYSYTFELHPKSSESDESNYLDFDKNLFPNVVENVSLNLADFGYYHTVLNANEVSQNVENGIGDAVDDLSDIIYDLLEVKWRIEKNSLADGLWYFQFIFQAHTKEHLINLLNYLLFKK
ncbi:hypothetical protein [Sediminitomix flava]|uniref:DUF5063 domain-containing protein n=1 Tax=Sediminitomix flava TaxID=379075 RepID=A0A315ZI92_SEDFL|nr:hypothetical protein [Sediminitomix flava]PWJ32897.1 hypothetical protein BC781_1183 [Sediminitomix flava]